MRVAIIGGDKRTLFAARGFADSGCEVYLGGFDKISQMCGVNLTSLTEAAEASDMIVLPVRPVIDDELFAPFSDERYPIAEFADVLSNKPVFSGFAGSIKKYLEASIYDYTAREEFSIRNAVLTAEGALELIMREYEDSVFGADVLISGYGRIGRILARYLKGLGACVTAAVRRPEKRAWAVCEGINVCDYSFREIKNHDIIINTVPAQVFNADVIDRMDDDVFIIDLASSPGGFDTVRAQDRGLTLIGAPGLPGKTSPKAAGRIIKDTIMNIIKEENGGKDNSGLRDDRLFLHL